MNRKKYVLILLLILCLSLIGCGSKNKRTSDEDKKLFVTKVLKKYDVTVEDITIVRGEQGYLQLHEDSNYRGYVKISDDQDNLIVVSGYGRNNYQSLKYFTNVEEIMRKEGNPNLIENCEFLCFVEYDEKDTPVMSFEEYCKYDWERKGMNPNRWSVEVIVWNISDEDAIKYVIELKDRMKEFNINCEYSVSNAEVSQEEFLDIKESSKLTIDREFHILTRYCNLIYFDKEKKILSISAVEN